MKLAEAETAPLFLTELPVLLTTPLDWLRAPPAVLVYPEAPASLPMAGTVAD